MFYSHDLLGRKTPLGAVWTIAHGKKLSKCRILGINVADICKQILQPDVPYALRLQGILIGGVVVLCSKQQVYLFEDVQDTLKRVKAATVMEVQPMGAPATLPKGKGHARPEAITLAEVDDLMDASILDADGMQPPFLSLSARLPGGHVEVSTDPGGLAGEDLFLMPSLAALSEETGADASLSRPSKVTTRSKSTSVKGGATAAADPSSNRQSHLAPDASGSRKSTLPGASDGHQYDFQEDLAAFIDPELMPVPDELWMEQEEAAEAAAAARAAALTAAAAAEQACSDHLLLEQEQLQAPGPDEFPEVFADMMDNELQAEPEAGTPLKDPAASGDTLDVKVVAEDTPANEDEEADRRTAISPPTADGVGKASAVQAGIARGAAKARPDGRSTEVEVSGHESMEADEQEDPANTKDKKKRGSVSTTAAATVAAGSKKRRRPAGGGQAIVDLLEDLQVKGREYREWTTDIRDLLVMRPRRSSTAAQNIFGHGAVVDGPLGSTAAAAAGNGHSADGSGTGLPDNVIYHIVMQPAMLLLSSIEGGADSSCLRPASEGGGSGGGAWSAELLHMWRELVQGSSADDDGAEGDTGQHAPGTRVKSKRRKGRNAEPVLPLRVIEGPLDSNTPSAATALGDSIAAGKMSAGSNKASQLTSSGLGASGSFLKAPAAGSIGVDLHGGSGAAGVEDSLPFDLDVVGMEEYPQQENMEMEVEAERLRAGSNTPLNNTGVMHGQSSVLGLDHPLGLSFGAGGGERGSGLISRANSASTNSSLMPESELRPQDRRRSRHSSDVGGRTSSSPQLRFGSGALEDLLPAIDEGFLAHDDETMFGIDEAADGDAAAHAAHGADLPMAGSDGSGRHSSDRRGTLTQSLTQHFRLMETSEPSQLLSNLGLNRTAMMVIQICRQRIAAQEVEGMGGAHATTSFFSLATSLKRSEAVKLFYQLCVTSSAGYLTAAQSTPYGDIEIGSGRFL